MPLSFPTTPATDEVYTFNGRSWVFNGTSWDAVLFRTFEVTASEEEPPSPEVGDLWLDLP